MKRAGIALLALLAVPATAQVAVGFNALSMHSQPGYESLTPGVYVRSTGPYFYSAGAFRNSLGFPTAHASVGYSWQQPKFDLSIAVGASYGYRDRYEWTYTDGSAPNFYTYGPPELNLLITPSAGVKLTDQWTLRTFFLPAVKQKTNAYCLSFSLEYTFKD